MKTSEFGIPAKPAALDMYTQRRWEHSALRRRLLIGDWQQDLENTLAQHIPSDRRAAWGVSDLSSNVFKSSVDALSALYNDQPAVGLPSGSADASSLLGSGGYLDRAGLWPLMQRVQSMTLGMREMLIRVDVNSKGDGLLFRPVTPDMVFARAPAGDPMVPDVIHELRLRYTKTGDPVWTADVFDLRDLNNPIYRIQEVDAGGELGRDVTGEYMAESNYSGAAYPYRRADGTPVIPYSMYHASMTGHLFSPYDLSEAVYGSLTAACLYTFAVHVLRDCSHPQRYVAGLQPAGAGIYDTDLTARRAAIATDPASILVFQIDTEIAGVGQPMIGQFNAGADPVSVFSSVTQYERRVAAILGIDPSDVQKMSGDPRSGYAIAISRSGQRDAQRKYAPLFRYGDLQTIELAAIMANRFLGQSLPESGYTIEYQAIPLSDTEQKAQREDLIEKLSKGLLTPIDAIKDLHVNMTDAEAVAYLRDIRAQRAEFGF